MRKATISLNRKTNRYEVYVIGVGLAFRTYEMEEAYRWADDNGYDLVEYD